MSWERYRDLRVPGSAVAETKRRYSVTADVISFRRCPRQYGFLADRGFVPSQPTQAFVGTIIHQVLDRAHAHYMGRLDSATKETIPTDLEIEGYFAEVENALKARGIRPVARRVRDVALDKVKAFNIVEGPVLYPLVQDTEHRLQTEQEDYILHGVVDVLASSPDSTDPEDVEIWDYKGSKRPLSRTSDGRKRLEDFEFQMLVYADLFHQRNGRYPRKAIMYFVGELSGKDVSEGRPDRAIMEVELTPSRIQTALTEFDETVQQIASCRAQNNWQPPPGGVAVAGKEQCDLCDFRWTCPEMEGAYHPRYP